MIVPYFNCSTSVYCIIMTVDCYYYYHTCLQDTEKKKETLPRMVSSRVSPATQRVQQEIELANQREKEMKQWGSDDLQKVFESKIARFSFAIKLSVKKIY